jgi:hypothetical protein
MEREIFDRDTLLDLVVNFIPLGIILFFVGVYLFRQPWGFDLGASGIMLALLVVPFVALAVLTYVSAVAIAGDEQDKPNYAQGQAGLEGATPLHEDEGTATGTADESETTEGGDEVVDDEPTESEADEGTSERDDTGDSDEGTAGETADDDGH